MSSTEISEIYDNLLDKLNANIDLKSDPSLPKHLTTIFQTYYKNQDLCDFEFIVGSNQEIIKAHKVFLVMKGCASLREVDHCLDVEDVSKESLQAVIESIYSNDFEFEVNSANVDQLIKIGHILGNDLLIEKYSRLKTRSIMEALTKLKTETESVMTSIKRKSESSEPNPKRRKTSNEGLNQSANRSTNPLSNPLTTSSTTPSPKPLATSSSNSPNIVLKQSPNDSSEPFKRPLITQSPTPLSDRIVHQFSDESQNRSPNKVSNDSKQLNNKWKAFGSKQTIGSDEDSQRLVTDGEDRDSSLAEESEGLNSTADESDIEENLVIDESTQSAEAKEPNDQNSQTKRLNYVIDRFFRFGTKHNINVWNCRFVPKRNGQKDLEDNEVIAVVGSNEVLFFDLDNNYAQIGKLVAPEDKQLKCIAFTQLGSLNVMAIGSDEVVYVTSQPKLNETKDLDKSMSLLGFNDSVESIEFHNCRKNTMFCGTADKKVMVWELRLKNDGSLHSESAKVFESCAGFPIVSIIYVPKYDTLVASGESSNLFFVFNITAKKPAATSMPYRQKNCKSISSLIYIESNDLICFRSADLDFLQTTKLKTLYDRFFEKQKLRTPSKNSIRFEEWNKLLYSKAPKEKVEFIYLNQASDLIGCGDHLGRIFLYTTHDLRHRKDVHPKQVIVPDWPNQPPIIRSVLISEDKRYVVSTTNSNTICVYESFKNHKNSKN